MRDISAQSPEERRLRHEGGTTTAADVELDTLAPRRRVYAVIRRVLTGLFSDGFIHAGNLAYLALLSLFPFFIIVAAITNLVGRSSDTHHAVISFLDSLPPQARSVLHQPIEDVLMARTGNLLWLGAIVGLWSVGSFIETIRDILRRAYGSPFSKPFWHYRLWSMGLIIASVVMMVVAFAAQIMLTAVEQFVIATMPLAAPIAGWIGFSKLAPLLIVWGALYVVFWALTPDMYRSGNSPKWPGALLTALGWYGALNVLPLLLSRLSDYSLTYGSLAGVIIALIFFWTIGLGLVVGAQLNAALAEPYEPRLQTRSETGEAE